MLAVNFPPPSLPSAHHHTPRPAWSDSVFVKAWPQNSLYDSYCEAFTTSLGRLQSLLGLLTFLLCRLRCVFFLKKCVLFVLFRWFPWLHYFLPFLIGNHKFILLWDSSTHLFVIWSIKGLFLKFLLFETQTNPISFWVREKQKYTLPYSNTPAIYFQLPFLWDTRNCAAHWPLFPGGICVSIGLWLLEVDATVIWGRNRLIMISFLIQQEISLCFLDGVKGST